MSIALRPLCRYSHWNCYNSVKKNRTTMIFNWIWSSKSLLSSPLIHFPLTFFHPHVATEKSKTSFEQTPPENSNNWNIRRIVKKFFSVLNPPWIWRLSLPLYNAVLKIDLRFFLTVLCNKMEEHDQVTWSPHGVPLVGSSIKWLKKQSRGSIFKPSL